MDKSQIQVLLIEDNLTDVIFLREALGEDALTAFEVQVVERLNSAVEILQSKLFDIILLDLGLPDGQSLETFTRIHQIVPHIPKVILSGLTDETLAMQAVHAGAQDYLVKNPAGFASAARAIRYAIERGESQKQLRAREERFRALIENGADDISLLGADGTLIWESPAVVRNLGYAENTFVGKNIFEIVHPDDRAWTDDFYAKLIQKPGSRQQGTFRLRHSDGTWRWVEAVVTNMLDNPSVQAIVVNYHDITERKQAEEKQHQSEQRYRALFESSPIAIWEEDFSEVKKYLESLKQQGITDFKAYFATHPDVLSKCSLMIRVLNVNNTALQMYQADSKRQLIEDTNQSVSNGELVHNHEDFIAIAEGRTSNGWEGADKTYTGETIEISLRWSVVPGYEDDFSRVIVTTADITERKRAEKELREEQEKAQKYLDIAGVMLLALDQKGMVTLINQKGCEILGYAYEEIVGKNWINTFLPLAIREEMQSVFQKLVDGDIQASNYYENTVLTKAGEQRMIAWHNTLMRDGEGRVISSLSSGEDITGRKQAERILHQSEQRYRALFENMPIAIWEEDFSEVKRHLSSLKGQGITDFHAYFAADPDAVVQCLEMIKILDVNSKAVEMYQAKSKDELIRSAQQEKSKGELENCINDLMAIADGKTSRGWEGEDETMNDAPIAISLNWTVVPGYEYDFSRVIVTTVDISERKRAEEALRQSENRYRTVVENQSEFIVRWKSNGVRTFVNDAYCRYYGLSAEEAISTDFLPLIHADDRPAVQEKISRLLSGKINFETDIHRVIKPDGNIGWQEWTDQAIHDKFGQIIEFQSVGRDITERKQDEQRLQESNERFEQLANNIEEAFWITSATTGEEIYLSPASEKIWGMSLEELMKPNAFLENVITEDRSIVEAALSTQGHGGKTEIEYRTIGLDGTIHWIWDRAFPIFDGSGNAVRVAGIAADITERKIVEEQLRKLSSAVRQSASIIVITDTAGKIEYVNPKFTEITGYTFEEASGQNPRILKSGHTSPEVYESLWNIIKSGQEWHGELLNRKKNGELYWESVSISPISNERGETTHFIAVKEDISDRKNNELNIRRNLAELEALYENGLAVGRLLNQNEIGERIIATFARHLSWHHVAIRLIEPEGNEMKLIAFNQEGLSMTEMDAAELHLNSAISKVSQGLSGWVVQTGQSLRTGNVHAQPQYVATYPNIQSGLYMPLKLGDLSIGVISVESEEPDAFTEQDERLLATLANQAAIAFENARLYQSAQQELQERKRAETALRISETHYRELADSITDIFFELDQNLHYSHWNKASELLTGVSQEDAIGRSMRDIFGDSEEQSRIEKIYADVLVKHQPRTFETLFMVNNQPRLFEVNAYPSVRGVAVVAKDVTERKRFEIIMQKRFELMEFAAGHSLEEIMQMATDEVGNLTGSAFGFFHILETDQATPGLQIWPTNTLKAFNVPVSEGRHRSVEQAGVWAEAIRQRRAIIHNDYESLPNKKALPPGHAPIIRELVIPIIRNEKILAVMGIANKPEEYSQQDLETAERFVDYAWDITERKQMEVALSDERNQLSMRVEERTADLSRANSNLARALRVKDEFLANMSHELRTPLNAILGLLESLAEQTAGPLNEKQQRYINTVNESGHHLLSLINDILDLAKIEAGQITLDFNKVDVNSVCQASLRMIKQLARKKNQEVVVAIDGRVSLMWADERRLKQMLVNLLGNAVKFTPDGGKLGLEVHGDQEANRVTFTIWDTGIGIKETDLPRLFQPFVQLDAGLAREASGTGLGLALVAQMARLHGGSASVTSQPGQGSRFTIMVPWEPALASDTVERLKTTGKFRPMKFDQGHKPTILLIEDTEEVIMMLSDYLESNGYKIVTARDGVEGVIQAQLAHPDLILMDVQMPRMDGFEATKKLRGEPEFEHTPIIALTALAMPNDRERCLAAGMDEYITKPVHLRALVKVIEKFLSAELEIKPQ